MASVIRKDCGEGFSDPAIAPVVIFVYNRLAHTMQAVESLKRNNLASKSYLHIFSDGAKPGQEYEVARVREYLDGITGFAGVHIYPSPVNMGCASSVISGVSRMMKEHETVIAVEDDLVVSPNFLDYMNAALDYYKNKNVWAIAGWGIDLHFDPNDASDVHYSPRGECWGWATWRKRWENVDWAVSDYATFQRLGTHCFSLNEGGGDLSRLLDLQMAGKIDSWVIRWCYAQHKAKMLTVYPRLSKAINIGFYGTHQKGDLGYPVTLDDTNRTTFNFAGDITINEDIHRQFMYYYSYPYRIKNKIRRLFQRYCRF